MSRADKTQNLRKNRQHKRTVQKCSFVIFNSEQEPTRKRRKLDKEDFQKVQAYLNKKTQVKKRLLCLRKQCVVDPFASQVTAKAFRFAIPLDKRTAVHFIWRWSVYVIPARAWTFWCGFITYSLPYNYENQYHAGYESQVALWPENPLDTIIGQLKKEKPGLEIADFGCGTAKLAASLPKHKVSSFDLVAANSRVIACNMAHVNIFTVFFLSTRYLLILKLLT